ncbi:MAG: FTR1 family protein, partial [Flavobacteriales bacterium]
RWDLAFYVAGVGNTPELIKRGEVLWEKGDGTDKFTDLRALVTATPLEVHQQYGPDRAAVLAYLIAHPEAINILAPSPLAVTRAKLQASLDAYRNGDAAAARQLSISAYLEGFELIEAPLDNLDAPLRKETEREMMALRSTIGSNAPMDSVSASIGRINSLLDRAEEILSSDALSSTAAFVSSLLILLREGLEAILVLAAIIALVMKTGRRDALAWIHAGWIAAVVLGILTWIVARTVISISGANREMTEGITALLAAAMLLYVGYWLHNKSNTKAWQRFIREKVDSALGKSTLWTLAGISFLAVYRELFEIILFYETLLSQAGPSGQHAVLGGIGVALLLLAIIGGAILKFSVRLPIGPFFAATAGLLALMAVVFAGNGVAALQEAGVIHATIVRFISIPLLGIHATAQGLALQGIVLALVIAGIVVGRWRMRAAAAH